jgi:hypothetical protein
MILKRLQDKQMASASSTQTQGQEKHASVAKAADIYNSSLTQISSASS